MSGTPPAALPTPPSPLIGRSRELADLQRELARTDVRLVTLTGAPGVGKTRLALEAARGCASRFPDGVVYVPLASVDSVDRAVIAILDAVELPAEGGRRALRDFFRARACMLLLDNLEHLPEIGLVVADLLAWAPDLKVLTTSRLPLRVSGEHERPLLPLPVPVADANAALVHPLESPAITLFEARARAVDPAFSITSENAPIVAELCRRLDGLPLAIELAAARIKFVGVGALLERLGNRLETLRGGPRDLPARQRTLEAAIAWSYELLTEPQQRFFARLAVFVDGWTASAANGIASVDDPGDSLDALEALVDHSLVQHSSRGDERRFTMLETLREFALARLRDDPSSRDDARRRHAAYFIGVARHAAPLFRNGQTRAAVARLDSEHENLRAALNWSLSESDANGALALCASLGDYWRVRGFLSEGRAMIDSALRLHGGSDRDRAAAVRAAGTLARLQGDLASARDRLADAADLAHRAGDDATRADALTELGLTSTFLGQLDAAESQLADAWTLCERSADAWSTLSALHARARLAVARGNLKLARSIRSEAVELARRTGDPEWEARALVGLGDIARQQRDYVAARAYFEQALQLYREIQNAMHLALGLRKLSHVELHLGDHARARTTLLESLHNFQRVEHRGGIAACAIGLACVLGASGDVIGATRLLGAVELLPVENTGVLQSSDIRDRDELVEKCRSALGERGFDEALAQGRVTPLDQLVAGSQTESSRAAVTANASSLVGKEALHASLTARELDVLRLLPVGLSYAEIGERLFISPRTVDAHLRAIYAKLHVRSRHEAAGYAQRYGLAESVP